MNFNNMFYLTQYIQSITSTCNWYKNLLMKCFASWNQLCISHFKLGLCQVLSSHIRLVATVLDSAILEVYVYTTVYKLFTAVFNV